MRLCIIISLFAALISGCMENSTSCSQTLPVISWGGIAAEKADTLFSLAKECGFDIHLGLFSKQSNAITAMDAAAKAGIGIIINFPDIRDSTEKTILEIKDHPALIAYHLKDEPDTSDFQWLKDLHDRIRILDPKHPCYINLFPNWAWNEEEYADKIRSFADLMDIPFYSFDHYPVTESDGKISIRPEWYRNLEEFSEMAGRSGKPFWAFALATSHSISDPFPPAFYPEPTLGHIRLQVFSNLLYGAQAIQYFNFTGIVDPKTYRKKPAFDIIRQVNYEIKAYSQVFLGCRVLDVWHTGETIPPHTEKLTAMPHKKVRSLDVRGEGAVVSLIENNGRQYLAVQNRDCINPATLEISFSSKVVCLTPDGERRFNGLSQEISPGNVMIFRL